MHHTEPIKKARISIRGIVQGVGFRPFVYQLATKNRLKGWVCNTSGAVEIEVEGTGEAINCFFNQLNTQPPPLSQIDEIKFHYSQPEGYQAFEIKESQPEKGKYQRISPDIATCALCLKELFDKKDRRYRYPFINCTNCGPRFTIIKDIPYDRSKTTMRNFKMCPECQSEYENPFDRRFHAQPNCCPWCGPHLELVDQNGRFVASKDPISDAAALIKKGEILAIKGLGGFLLACDATNECAVQLLRQRKKRPFKPFALMMLTVDEIKKHCLVSPEEERLLRSTKAPIVLLKCKDKSFVAPAVAPNLNYLGVMLPYTPLHHLLLREVRLPLVMTSGNLSEEPIAKDNHEGLRKLKNIADYFLFHNRDIHIRCDDSIVIVENNKEQVIRRARSYAPDPIHLSFKAKQILACGAELKNTFCITRDEYAFISQHIGDLDNVETLMYFEEMIEHYKKLFRLQPTIVAHDKHPNYLSTRHAQELKSKDTKITLVPVQHHHAHIVSCIVDNNAEPPILGVAFDGTGYGEDGCIWGGEFLLADYTTFRRLGHLEYIPMPGGEVAIKKPYRMTMSYLLNLLGKETLNKPLQFLEKVDEFEVEIVKKQIEKGINAPMTSSAGRLFDAVSALLDIRNEVDYEGQAAIELEMLGSAEKERQRIYPFEIVDKNGVKVTRIGKLFAGILEDLSKGIPKSEIAASFHHTISQIIVRMCQIFTQETEIRQVVLSGGVFQNRLLLMLTRRYLEDAGMNVLTHGKVPCNDGGISLGQAVIANFIIEQT